MLKNKKESRYGDDKPKNCYECKFFGANNLLEGKSTFPSLCEKNLLWFNCKGKKGIKNE